MTNRPTRYNEALGHDVRADHWAHQGRSTYKLALDALVDGRREDAAALARLTIQEAHEAYDLYLGWLLRLPELLAERGILEPELSHARAKSEMVWEGLADGWTTYVELIELFARESDPMVLEQARSTWQAAHDPATDQLAELLELAVDKLGEACVGPLWDDLLGHYYAGLGEKYDPAVSPWDRSVERLSLDIFEAVRGHLTGPARDGQFDIREEGDRWVLRFAPCGSGGRTYPATSEEHAWAWNKKGVCLYCVHCCQLQQRAPIAQLGFPLRVIEPPVQASEDHVGAAVCTWSIYKELSKVPAHAYTDVGAVPPKRHSTTHEQVSPVRTL